MFRGWSRVWVALAALLSVSCATTIRPPASPEDPRTVVLITHGWSSSLVLPTDEGDRSRWTFGDWNYYALWRKGLFETLAALFWPTDSTLGRQRIRALPGTPERISRAFGIGIDRVFVISVSGEAVAALEQRLDELFAAHLATRHYNPDARLEFVRLSESYTLLNNSNRKIAEWLEELGCGVSGFPLLARWRVVGAVRESR